MTKAELAAYMRRARLDSGLTQVQVAERMGVKQSTVSSWEIGVNEPGVETLTAWGDAIGAPLRLQFDRGVSADSALMEAAALLPADDRGRLVRAARALRRLPHSPLNLFLRLSSLDISRRHKPTSLV
jgi:transcriptional regulator with XRE-family HTH domain